MAEHDEAHPDAAPERMSRREKVKQFLLQPFVLAILSVCIGILIELTVPTLRTVLCGVPATDHGIVATECEAVTRIVEHIGIAFITAGVLSVTYEWFIKWSERRATEAMLRDITGDIHSSMTEVQRQVEDNLEHLQAYLGLDRFEVFSLFAENGDFNREDAELRVELKVHSSDENFVIGRFTWAYEIVNVSNKAKTFHIAVDNDNRFDIPKEYFKGIDDTKVRWMYNGTMQRSIELPKDLIEYIESPDTLDHHARNDVEAMILHIGARNLDRDDLHKKLRDIARVRKHDDLKEIAEVLLRMPIEIRHPDEWSRTMRMSAQLTKGEKQRVEVSWEVVYRSHDTYYLFMSYLTKGVEIQVQPPAGFQVDVSIYGPNDTLLTQDRSSRNGVQIWKFDGNCLESQAFVVRWSDQLSRATQTLTAVAHEV
jgi:hypothetical protein